MAKSPKKQVKSGVVSSSGVKIEIETSVLHTALRVFIRQVEAQRPSSGKLPTKIENTLSNAKDLEAELKCQVSMYPSSIQFTV